MKDGHHATNRDCQSSTDETSIFLSPSIRRHPMTYFVYPGLDAPNLKGFLLQNQASTACIQKAMDHLGTTTPCPSLHDISGSVSHDNMSHISDDVFIDDVLEETEEFNDTVVKADETILDEVPLENSADDTDLAIQNGACSHELSKVSSNGVVQNKKRKGFSKFFVSLCACGGLKSNKHKHANIAPTTEL